MFIQPEQVKEVVEHLFEHLMPVNVGLAGYENLLRILVPADPFRGDAVPVRSIVRCAVQAEELEWIVDAGVQTWDVTKLAAAAAAVPFTFRLL